MYNEARFETGPTWAKWVKNFQHLEREGLDEESAAEWLQATEIMFDRTQQLVHIISGDLLDSGRVSITDRDKLSIESTITYGGTMGTEGPVDYATYEIARGGNHDFLTDGYQQSQAKLQRAAGQILENRFRRMGW